MKNKTPQSFQDWLEEYFINEVSPTTNKDNFEDRFDVWVSDLDYDGWTALGDKYGEAIVEEMRAYYAELGGTQ